MIHDTFLQLSDTPYISFSIADTFIYYRYTTTNVIYNPSSISLFVGLQKYWSSKTLVFSLLLQVCFMELDTNLIIYPRTKGHLPTKQTIISKK